MKHKIFLIIAVIALIITNSCKDNGTGPETLEPGRRDYVWTVDTINPGQESLYLGRIWGSSPDDVWAVGTSSWTATSIWHYDGLGWRCDSIPRKINPTAIFGISKNEVWLGNGNSTIWKYDGTQWQQFGEYKYEGFDRICINYLDGITTADIYGIGFTDVYNSNAYKAVMMRYNGYNWEFVSLPEIKASFETMAIEHSSRVLVISGMVYDPKGFIAKIYCWDGKELKELLSDNGNSFITKLGEEIYATNNNKIYKYSDKRLTLWKDNTGTAINGNIICGRSRNDFFIGAVDGIAHYNGADFNVLFKNTLQHSIEIMGGKIFTKDVIFIAVDFTIGKNLIIHGKLK